MFVQPKLALRLTQKQILTPGLVQMVTVLALNRLELKEMINQELVENPVLEESADQDTPAETPEELGLEGERLGEPADREILDAGVEPAAELPLDALADLDRKSVV